MIKTKLLTCSLLLMSSLPQAQSISETLSKCGKQGDSLKRLVCYDRLAAQINIPTEQEVLPATKATAPVLALKIPSKTSIPPTPVSEKTAEKAKIGRDNFGMEHKIRLKDVPDKIYAIISLIKKNAHKNLLLTLDNGQRWKQSGSDSLRLKVGEQVYVERGAIGSFFLSKEGVNRRMRVKRVN